MINIRMSKSCFKAIFHASNMRYCMKNNPKLLSRVYVSSYPCFSTFDPSNRRPKGIKVKKNESRRQIPSKPDPTTSLTKVSTELPPTPYIPHEETPTTFGSVLKQNLVFGLGMGLAFSIIGVIFSSMEETMEPGKYEPSIVLDKDNEDNIIDNRKL